MSYNPLTDEQKHWLETVGWKKMTIPQMAKHLNQKSATITSFFHRKNIEPITHKDLIAKEVIELHSKGEKIVISTLAEKLECSQYLIKEIITDFGLTSMTQPGRPTNKKLIGINAIIAEMMRPAKTEAEIKEVNKNRPPAIYTQTGSPLLDELRGMKTTKRENTLLI